MQTRNFEDRFLCIHAGETEEHGNVFGYPLVLCLQNTSKQTGHLLEGKHVRSTIQGNSCSYQTITLLFFATASDGKMLDSRVRTGRQRFAVSIDSTIQPCHVALGVSTLIRSGSSITKTGPNQTRQGLVLSL